MTPYNSETDSDEDDYDTDDTDDWCYGCGCNISGNTNFIFCQEDENFYCTECYETDVWIE